MEGYACWANSYDAAPNPLLKLEERTLAPWLPPLRGAAVLDVGCGTGRWLSRLLADGARAVGVDLSPAMLAVAAGKPHLGRCLVQGDLLHLPVRSRWFDMVLCSFVVEHCSHLDRLVGEIARITAPCGRVLISQLHRDAWQQGWRCRFHHGGGTVEVAGNPFSLEELSAAFTRAGFRLQRRLAPHLGEEEQPIFAAAGRLHAFADACRWPAILLCDFRREGP